MASKKASAPAPSADRGRESEIQRRREAKEHATTQEGETPPENPDINAGYTNPKLA